MRRFNRGLATDEYGQSRTRRKEEILMFSREVTRRYTKKKANVEEERKCMDAWLHGCMSESGGSAWRI